MIGAYETYRMDRSRYPISSHATRYMFWLRFAQDSNFLLRTVARLILHHYKRRYGLEIPYHASIGPGLKLVHPYNISVAHSAVIGKNCNLHKGAILGTEFRGVRMGSPILGDRVYVGMGAAVVGKVTIGDDVLIAPNCYVNRDIPSHSVVFGNPCIVKHRDHATEGYIVNV